MLYDGPKPLATLTSAEQRLVLFCVVALLLLLVFQTNYLPFHPLPDSLMWWGDESWRMLSARDLLLTGKPVIAEAYGSTLSQNIGLVGASSWFTHLLYGIPIVLAGKGADAIEIGRWVSLGVGLCTLGLFWTLINSLTLSRVIASFATLFFGSTDAFLYASHSARPDMITAFGITLFLYTSLLILKQFESASTTPLDVFIYCALWAAGPLLYVHVAPLTLLGFLYVLLKIKLWRSAKQVGAMALGGSLGVALWLVPYFILTKSFSLFGPTDGRTVQYNFVVMTMPLFHLFSPRVEEVNILWRMRQWLERAPILMISLCILGGYYLLRRLQRRTPHLLEGLQKQIVIVATLAVFSTFIVQGSAVFYMSHIMPALILLAIVPWNAATTVSRTASTKLLSYLSKPNLFYAVVLVGYATLSLMVAGAGSGAALKARSQGERILTRAAHHALPTIAHPRIMVDQGETAGMLTDTSIDLMTHHFMLFPVTRSPLVPSTIDSILNAQHTNFIMANDRQRDIMDYARYHLPLVQYYTAPMHEITRADPKSRIDTIFLFRVASR